MNQRESVQYETMQFIILHTERKSMVRNVTAIVSKKRIHTGESRDHGKTEPKTFGT